MSLSGLDPVSVRPRGGVAKVELIPASKCAGAVPGGGPHPVWAFREDRARYSEESAGDGPMNPLVRHVLEMELPAGPDTRAAVESLAAVASREGVVAVVTLASGEVIAAGWSARFAGGYPLRLSKAVSTSGRSPADFPSVVLTLESVDADASLPIMNYES